MGGRKFKCDDCDEITTRYNSCGDRHCPQCSGGKRVDFNDKASKLILPGVTYYQVVCTLPSELSELALTNRQAMADLLVDSAWKSVSKRIKIEQGYDPAAISVLHTWNQKLEAHWHVHMLVPGEGPSIDRNGNGVREWKQATASEKAKNSDGFYLVDGEGLREAYRKQVISALKRLRAAGKLKFMGKFAPLHSDENWDAFVKNLESKSWVAYIQPPPTVTSRADQVVNYLTRYLTGGPISDHRIVAADRDCVTFMAREGKRTGGEREQIEVTLPIGEFVKRWCLHIQPDQLTKTRYFGGWSNTRRVEYQLRCRELLESIGRCSVVTESMQVEASRSDECADVICDHCGSDRMVWLSETPKPSWKELFWREDERCPQWYAERQRESHRRFWTAEYGSDFYDWYLETQIEVAKERGPESRQLIQPDLPGFWGDAPRDEAYLIESY
jgi:Putative transposase/Transposase zinc-binding domain